MKISDLKQVYKRKGYRVAKILKALYKNAKALYKEY